MIRILLTKIMNFGYFNQWSKDEVKMEVFNAALMYWRIMYCYIAWAFFLIWNKPKPFFKGRIIVVSLKFSFQQNLHLIKFKDETHVAVTPATWHFGYVFSHKDQPNR